jgi:hypothetical protein
VPYTGRIRRTLGPLGTARWLALSLALGCAHTGGTGVAPEAPLRYAFEASSSIATSLYAPDGTERAASFGDPARRHWSGELEQRPSRRFRDGSQGDWIRFMEVQVQRDEQAPRRSDLSGLSAELRSFETREILEIDQLDHLVGDGRDADLMLPLWQALSPRVPELEPGQSVRQRASLPFLLDTGMGAPIYLDLTWSLSGPQPCGAHSCWHLEYQGPVTGKGLERTALWHARYRIEGQAVGELMLRQEDNAIVDSQLSFDLTIRTTLSDLETQVPRAVLRQQHQQRARVRPAEATP